jgi:hypothetical protein
MVAAYRDSIKVHGSGATITIDPASTDGGLTYSSGDVLLLHVWGVTSIGNPSGSDLTWTQILTDTIVGPFSNTYAHKVYWAVADASITSFTMTVAADSHAACLTSISGADTTTPIDGTPAIATDLGSVSVNPIAPAVSPSGTDSLLVCAFGAHETSGEAKTSTPPSGMTEREDWPTTSEFEHFSLATLGLSASGSTGAKTFDLVTDLDTAEVYAASSVAIKSGGSSTSPDAECATGAGAAYDTTVTSSDQSAGPSTDITTTGWTATGGTGTLASAIDETPADDADFITSPGNPSSSVAECKFPSFTDPAFSTGHRLDYRVRVRNAGSYTVVVAVYQSTTLIASTSHTSGLTSSFQDFTLTLSGAEADAITDYTDLRVRVTATAAV